MSLIKFLYVTIIFLLGYDNVTPDYLHMTVSHILDFVNQVIQITGALQIP